MSMGFAGCYYCLCSLLSAAFVVEFVRKGDELYIMKRPLAVIGLSFFAAQAVAALSGFAVAVALSAISLAAAVLCLALLTKQPAWLLPVLITVFAATLINTCCYAFLVRPVRELEGRTAIITGEIVSAPTEAYGRYYYIIKTSSVLSADAPQSVKLRLSSKSPIEAEVSDIVRAKVTFTVTDSTETVTAAARRLSDGIKVSCYLSYNSEVTVTRGARGLGYKLSQVSKRLKQSMCEVFDDQLASVLAGMSLGDTSSISSYTLREFRQCGLSHLLAVSGLHLSVLLYVLSLVLRLFGLPRRPASAVMIVFVLLYMALTGFSPSVTRAGIMNILALLAVTVIRDYEPLNALGTALLIICGVNPFAAADVSLLLSASATFGLITMHDPVMRYVSRRLPDKLRFDRRYAVPINNLLGAVVTTLLATLFTIPISALYFGELSIISPICNILCVTPAACFMVLGAAAALLNMIPFVGGVLSMLLAAPAWLIGKITLFVINTLSRIPNAGVSVCFDFLPMTFVCALLILVTWLVLFSKSRDRAAALLLCCAIIGQVFISGLLTYRLLRINEQTVTVHSVGDGLCVTLCSQGYCVMLGCGGDNYLLHIAGNDLADNNIVRLDALVIPGRQEEYASGAAEFERLMQPERVFLPPSGSLVEAAAAEADSISSETYCVTDSLLELGSAEISFSTYSGSGGELWCYAEVGATTILICPPEGDCLELPRELLCPDCAVIVGDSPANITALGAGCIVASADRSDSAQIAALLRYRGLENVYSTGINGSITLSRRDNALTVSY